MNKFYTYDCIPTNKLIDTITSEMDSEQTIEVDLYRILLGKIRGNKSCAINKLQQISQKVNDIKQQLAHRNQFLHFNLYIYRHNNEHVFRYFAHIERDKSSSSRRVFNEVIVNKNFIKKHVKYMIECFTEKNSQWKDDILELKKLININTDLKNKIISSYKDEVIFFEEELKRKSKKIKNALYTKQKLKAKLESLREKYDDVLSLDSKELNDELNDINQEFVYLDQKIEVMEQGGGEVPNDIKNRYGRLKKMYKEKQELQKQVINRLENKHNRGVSNIKDEWYDIQRKIENKNEILHQLRDENKFLEREMKKVKNENNVEAIADKILWAKSELKRKIDETMSQENTIKNLKTELKYLSE